jgi:CBS domain-containing protein
MTSTRDETTIADVMLRRPKTLAADATVADARTMFANKSVQLLLLVDDGRFVGAVSRIPEDADPELAALGFADDEAPITTEADLPVSVALERLGHEPGGRLIVVDEDETLLGLVCVTASGKDFCGFGS